MTFKVATIGGIDIDIDWTWLLAFAFFTWSLGAYYDTTFPSWGHTTAYLLGAVSTLLLFVTVLLHELGHSFTARPRPTGLAHHPAPLRRRLQPDGRAPDAP